ncbi:MAG: hypothetical protein UR81_C0004G0007 [Candidatus Levybacteria bacterium GW2011_GWB1_35_5]|nr:MAG: hypothetical protein UR81_C0004G0007 [Candidatus Levybacteria bacterium GW2011_GWB1_35_5]
MINNISDILTPNNGWHKSIVNTLDTYQYIYGLPIIKKSKKISNSFYNYCIKGKYFVVIALYNSKRDFFIQKDFLEDNNKWDLVGGWVREEESFDQALDRIVSKETGNKLVEAVPVSRVKNKYYTKDNRKVYHEGIAFLGRVLHDSISTQNGIFTSDVKSLLSKRDLSILKLCKKILEDKVIEPPLEEVDNSHQAYYLTKINKNIIKPLSYYLSSRILSRVIIEHAFPQNNTKTKYILDLSCGDDKSILQIAKKAKLLVANDISRDIMKSLINSSAQNIIFTNQNLLDLEYKINFDLVICKNTLHHMRSSEEVELLMKTLKKFSRKRIIIMDIENPNNSFLSKAWNTYYKIIMKDHGDLFISFNQFREILKIAFPNSASIYSKRILTIKGYYMLGVIDLL